MLECGNGEEVITSLSTNFLFPKKMRDQKLLTIRILTPLQCNMYPREKEQRGQEERKRKKREQLAEGLDEAKTRRCRRKGTG